MSVLYLLVPIAIVIVAAAIAAYVWAARRGQFDDLTTPAIRMLHDDTEPEAKNEAKPPDEEPRK